MLDPERWRELEPLVNDALDLPDAAARAMWLTGLRKRSPALAREVGELLELEERSEADHFLAERPLMHAELTGVGPYVFDRRLGDGGTSSVWLAHRDDAPNAHVAVKLLAISLRGSVGDERFRTEGAMLARLGHPSIVRPLEASVSPTGQPYLVLEYIDGLPIDDFARARSLTVHERVALVRQVVDAVAHAHAARVVHRDLKPSNVLVTADGTVKLLDFGIAKLLDEAGRGERSRLSQTGGSPMTPAFAAPEQVTGETITAATDVYAIGVLLYQMLADRHPTMREGQNMEEAIAALLDVDPAPVGISALDSVLARMLRKDPADRYQSADDLAADLDRYLARDA